MKLNIRNRIFLPVLLVLLVLPLAVWLVFCAVSQRYMERVSQQEIDLLLKQVQTIAQEAFPESGEVPDPELERTQSKAFVAEVKKMLRQTQNDAQLMILTSKRELVYPKNLNSQLDARALYDYLTYTSDAKELEIRDFQRIVLDGRNYLIRVWQPKSGGNVRAKYLIAYNPLYNTAGLLKSIGGLVLLISSVLAGLSLIVAWKTADSIARPMKRLCAYAGRIGKGEFCPVDVKSKISEVTDLNRAMGEMSAQLERSGEMQKMFLQNASHELRTPLMSISGYAQGMQCGVFADSKEPLDAILSESRRLTELVDELLSLSRMDCEKETLEPRVLNLAVLAGACLEHLGGFALERGVRVSFPGEDFEVLARVDEKLFAQAFSNIVSNGVRFAKSAVAVNMIQINGRVTVSVEDDGEGISQEDQPHIFERFYKGKGGNSGLGLAIAKASIEYMGGEIRARNGSAGAVFEIVLDDCGNKKEV